MMRYWLTGGAVAAVAVSALTLGGSYVDRAVTGTAVPVHVGDSLREVCGDVARDRRDDCYNSAFASLAANRGARFAMEALERVGGSDAAIRARGHVYAHGIGIAAGHAGDDVAATFASCNEQYASGCYHGVIQAYFQDAETVDAASINALCEAYAAPGADQWLRYQCVHGMGHGLTMFYHHDLMRALEDCDRLEEAWERSSCYSGAFMENIVNAVQPHHSAAAGGGDHDHHGTSRAPAFKALDAVDAQYPCSVVAERFLDECYVMQPSAFLHRTGHDVAAAARLCAEAPGRLAYVCHQGLGRDISARAQFRAARAITLCGLAQAEYQPWCHFGVVKDIVMQRARGEDGIAYCNAVPGTRNRMKCLEAVGEMLTSLENDPAQRAQACAAAGASWQSSCLWGARISGQRPLGLPEPRATSRRTASL